MRLMEAVTVDTNGSARDWSGGWCSFYSEFTGVGGGTLTIEHKDGGVDADWALVSGSSMTTSLSTLSGFIGKGQVRAKLDGATSPVVEGVWLTEIVRT